jgi:hypothetical protein
MTRATRIQSMNMKYSVRLTDQERNELAAVIKKFRQKRCQEPILTSPASFCTLMSWDDLFAPPRVA